MTQTKSSGNENPVAPQPSQEGDEEEGKLKFRKIFHGLHPANVSSSKCFSFLSDFMSFIYTALKCKIFIGLPPPLPVIQDKCGC
jgi:hypothetical protein